MSNPFGWQEVGLRDTGMATQAAIRTAQSGINGISNEVDIYQAARTGIDTANFQTQGKLNNQKIANRIRESGMTAEQFSQAQQDGGLSGSALAGEFGINYDASAAQTGIDAKQAELAHKEIQNIASIGTNKEEIEKQGVGGLNVAKSRILAYAQTPAQLKSIKEMYATQEEIVLSKQNADIINRALGNPSQVKGGKGFGGLFSDGLSRTADIKAFAVNQVAKLDYNDSQAKRLYAELDVAEKVSTELNPTQQAVYAEQVQARTAEAAEAMTHLNTRQQLNMEKLKSSEQLRESVDLTGREYTSRQLFDAIYKGDNSYDDAADLFTRIKKKTANMSRGRAQAVQSTILANVTNFDDVTTDQIDSAVTFNKENHEKYLAQYKEAADEYTDINDTILNIKNEGKSFGIKSMYAISKNKGAIPQPALANYTAKLRQTSQEKAAELLAYMNPNKIVEQQQEQYKQQAPPALLNREVVAPNGEQEPAWTDGASVASYIRNTANAQPSVNTDTALLLDALPKDAASPEYADFMLSLTTKERKAVQAALAKQSDGRGVNNWLDANLRKPIEQRKNRIEARKALAVSKLREASK